jgi:glycosyltransferase involved in cell wall biosynthesis
VIKAWLIHLGEPLPIDGPVRLLRYGVLAEMLTDAGHVVTQWGTTFAHSEKRQRSSRDERIVLSDRHTIQLMRTGGYRKNRSLARLRYLRDGAQAFARCARSAPSPDIILVSMPSPGMCRAVLDYAGPLEIPVVVDVRDLWPDIFLDIVPVACAPLMRFALRPAFRANQEIFERTTAIIAISEQYLSWGLLQSGRDPRDTDRVFPMGYPTLSVSDADRTIAEEFWAERGVKADSFLCSFIGTINHHFDFGPVIECARKMPDVQFVICGKGDGLARLQRLSQGSDNVLLPGWVDKAQIISLMKLSDIGLAPYSAKARMSLPNKVFEYFFGGLPVVSSLRGESETLLKEHQCGVSYDPTDRNDLFRQLHRLVADPVGVRAMGERAKRLYEDRFSSNLVYSELICYLEGLVRSRGQDPKLSHKSGK